MLKHGKKALILSLKKALQSAYNDAEGYADMGQTEESIHAKGRIDGLQQALEIAEKTTKRRCIFF